MTRAAILRRGAAIAALAVGGLGCHGETRSATPPPDPERSSGADRQRAGAVAMPNNRPVTDEVSWEKGDATDWKMVTLDGKPGLLEARLHWDNAAADLLIDVFSPMGDQIASSPGLSPGSVEKRITVEIPAPGQYFLRVAAHGKEDASVYTLEATWAGAVASPPPLAAGDIPDETPPIVEEPPSAKDPPTMDGDDDRGLQGRIVQAMREGEHLTIYLDKGAKAGVTVGNRGAILVGPTGSDHLADGGFTITQVVDERRSIARCDAKSPGRGSRVIIYVGR